MKRLISFCLAFLICFSLSVPAFADVALQEVGTVISSNDSDEAIRAEETIWYFRVWAGIRQMRLWSITYRKWLTDWIDIGPAD